MDARNRAEGIRTRTPLAAITGMLELRADEAGPTPLGKRKARPSRRGQRRNQQDETPRDGRLDGDDDRRGRKQLAESRREPEGRNREDREGAGDRMDDFDHGYATQTP